MRKSTITDNRSHEELLSLPIIKVCSVKEKRNITTLSKVCSHIVGLCRSTVHHPTFHLPIRLTMLISPS